MLAAENGALEGAKVGGMADVIRDLPEALASVGVVVDVVMPSYGFLTSSKATLLGELEVPFTGRTLRVKLYRMPHPAVDNASIYLLEHGLWQSTPGKIYSQGTSERPFADDATKFALLCSSFASALVSGLIPQPDMLHLHDWHTGCFAMLRAFAPEYQSLKSIECVFSIHNLALQGIRPLQMDASSLAAWFPALFASLNTKQLAAISDPRYPHCINPMRMGIVLSDRVHLVSKTYAKEVLLASKPELGFFGGEGLEADLQSKAEQGNVFGIINGSHYRPLDAELAPRMRVADFKSLLTHIDSALAQWQATATQVSGVDMIACIRTQALWRQALSDNLPPLLLTSVGRLTDQKVLILRHILPTGLSVLETLMLALQQDEPEALFIMLGSGDAQIAIEFQRIAAKFSNFLFLHGYHEALSESLYKVGDMFIMPSSFEPCGISQMLAMRQGQPCIVHGVGGLKDTVVDAEDGFVFYGDSIEQQGLSFMNKLCEAIALFKTERWQQVRQNAHQKRFSWGDIAKEYKTQLYHFL
ncbi:glycogen synthase [Shewanella acanthi]|uniref:glycogen synthase n=1 Tax=Shewanella acanthi TaxID=2864212 RepID=UPI001C65850F|nr:glycogen/starch synthase [Shewanella acanthi]QYJ80645.1 glycogen/starch synthase [Shewanella acanthi]